MPDDASEREQLLEILTKVHYLGPTADGESIYDIPIKSVDGTTSDLLSDRHGEVTMIVNVTGECGNSMQYPMLQVLEYDYADQGFKVICVPTNDYCEYGYGDFKDSKSTAMQCYEYAFYNYRVRMDFTELVASRVNHDDEPYQYPHPLYQRLGVMEGPSPIRGNFEKWVISRDGKRRARFTNGALLPANFEMGSDDYGPKEALRRIRGAIEFFLAETKVQ